jgi:glycosyltransferase involved in cell wall biosynthesis
VSFAVDEGEVLGMAVEHAQASTPEARPRPYVLYCGRIDRAKGCDELLRAFERLPSRSRFTLTFTGEDNLGLPASADIEYLGFVDEPRKRALMAGASVFVLPSQYESFSIVTLEAMAQGTPVLVNGRCDVMREHIERSGGGLCYDSTSDMVDKLERLCVLAAGERARMGAAGRAYVLDNYREERVRECLTGLVERVIARSGAQAA